MTNPRPTYTWTDPQPVKGYPLSAVIIWRHGRWDTIAHLTNPSDAVLIAQQWAGEFEVEIWERINGAAPRRTHHYDADPDLVQC